MSVNRRKTLCLLSLLIGGGILWIWYILRPIAILDESLIGRWNRVEFADAVVPINWRKFNKNGTTAVRYGDVILLGNFAFVDNNTIEIRQHGETQVWNVLLSDDHLVLTNERNKWVEKYQRVPQGRVLEGETEPSLIETLASLWGIRS